MCAGRSGALACLSSTMHCVNGPVAQLRCMFGELTPILALELIVRQWQASLFVCSLLGPLV